MARMFMRSLMVIAAALAVAGCSNDGESTDSISGDPPAPLLPADRNRPDRDGGFGLGSPTTEPRITPEDAAPDADCPTGSVRWITERSLVEDQGYGDPRVWFVTVTGRVENQTSERIVTNVQDLEIYILRLPAWDGATPYYTSAPTEAGTLGPGGRTSWRAHETVQSTSRPRVGSIRAAPTWENHDIARRCPPPSGVGAKARPAL